MKNFRIAFIAIFLFFCFGKIHAQVQVSDQKINSGVSISDTLVDLSVPRISQEKMSDVSTDNSTRQNPDNRRDSVPVLNTNRMAPPQGKPKN